MLAEEHGREGGNRFLAFSDSWKGGVGMGQMFFGFALGWLAFTKEGKEVAQQVSKALSSRESRGETNGDIPKSEPS